MRIVEPGGITYQEGDTTFPVYLSHIRLVALESVLSFPGTRPTAHPDDDPGRPVPEHEEMP